MAKFSSKLPTNELAFVLRNLTASENSDTFSIVDQSISAGTEISLSNKLSGRGIIPQGYWVYKQTGNGLVTAGDTDWTLTTLTLKNHGAASVTVSVIFFSRV